MNKHFNYIGITGQHYNNVDYNIYKILCNFLIRKGINIVIDINIAKKLNLNNVHITNLKEITQCTDLIIVVGGDGIMLSVLKTLIKYNNENKIIGVNIGNLGFLTDLEQSKLLVDINNICNGKYFIDSRFFLKIKVNKNGKTIKRNFAINEIMIHSEQITKMTEIDVYINDMFSFSQRSDGLIIATPTGSTAYSLSAGGPILAPNVNAVLLVLMFPHNFNTKPLIISNTSMIKLCFSKSKNKINVFCDNKILITINKNYEILIKSSTKHLNLIHPKNYNFFETLQIKLGLYKKLF